MIESRPQQKRAETDPALGKSVFLMNLTGLVDLRFVYRWPLCRVFDLGPVLRRAKGKAVVHGDAEMIGGGAGSC